MALNRSLAIAALLSGCTRPAAPAIEREPTPIAKSTCVGERVPTDLHVAKVPYPNSVSISGDGSWVAAQVGQSGESATHVDNADGVVVWSAADGVVRERYRLDAWHVAFAPDGERIAFATIGETGILDRRTGCAQRWPIRGPLLRWRGDGRLIVAGDGHMRSIDVSTGRATRELAIDEPAAMDLAPPGIAVIDKLHDVHIVASDLSSQRELPSTLDGLGNADVVAIAPTGALVAAGAVEKTPRKYPPNMKPGSPFSYKLFVRLMALPSGDELERFPCDAYALAFSPDSASLAVADDRVLSIRTIATKAMRVLDADLRFAEQLVWSANGHSIALADWRGAVRIYDVATGNVRVLTP